jgi:hypothetical protein
MYYSNAKKTIEKIFKDEQMKFKKPFLDNFLEILSCMCNYSEEDHRIRPKVIVGQNLNSYFETIKPSNYYVMYTDNQNGNELPRLFKSLALFCDNGWYIVINHENKEIEYGIFRRYTEISGERFDSFFTKSFDGLDNCKMLIVEVAGSFEIEIINSVGKRVIISQRFLEEKGHIDTEKVYQLMAEDVVKECDCNNDQVKNSFLKMFRNLPQIVHGTIILVVKNTYSIPSEKLSGLSIKPPINFGKVFLDHEKINSYSEAESVYALTGALYDMLNTDGITIITDKGEVINYNVFYKGDIPQNIRGGARKRTALGILESSDLNGVIGVYFQSQDGDIFYERKEENNE